MEKFLDEMNLHERRAFEKIRLHKCENCGHEYKGWTSDNLQNTYLTSFCPKCDHENRYDYWGAAAYKQNKKSELLPNLAKSTENLSKIKNKDEWLDEVRGNDSFKDNSDEMCFHECPNCNSRCNCDDQPCSCCEVEENKEPISEDELIDKFKDAVNESDFHVPEFISNVKLESKDYSEVLGHETKLLSNKCAKIAQQYTNSKLEELEKWIEERNSGYKEYVIKHTSVATSAAIAELDIIKDKIKSLKQ